MSEINHIKVVIDETVYELSSSESPEYIQSVARYIDKKIKEIYAYKSAAAINPRLKTLYISLNIADDLFKERAKNEKLKEKIEDLDKLLAESSNGYLKLDKENIMLTEKVNDLMSQLELAKNELEEYKEAFEIESAVSEDGKVTRLK